MADYFFKIFTSLRNCNVACSPALRLGGASEQLSGLCLQKVHSPLFKLGTIEKRLEGGDGRDGGLLTHFTWAAGEPETYAVCNMRE